ncbi:MAG: mRNA decapping complex catalytic subunit Dcp2 [Amphiamblys sp. WSBS2006]|nr:MAG: mRNA decapping complex catalytic subunit Dcp2 [Amphiamblys sp. WSBS2006]
MSLSLSEIFEELCVRFIVNIPKEEQWPFQRIGFQIEQAFWFYEENYLPENPDLPQFRLRPFFQQLYEEAPFVFEPFLTRWKKTFAELYDDFIRYKFSVPCSGAIIFDDSLTKVLLVRGASKKSRWGFPRGKINEGEAYLQCAIREVYEETSIDISAVVDEDRYIDIKTNAKTVRLFVVAGANTAVMLPRTQKEITGIEWHDLDDFFSKSNERMYTETDTAIEQVQAIVQQMRAERATDTGRGAFCFDTARIMDAYRKIVC